MVKTRRMMEDSSCRDAKRNKEDEEYEWQYDRRYIAKQGEQQFTKADITEEECKKACDMMNELERKMRSGTLNMPERVYYKVKEKAFWIIKEFRRMEEVEEQQEREKRYQFLGYIFRPDEGILVDHYLRKKCMGEMLVNCPIVDIEDVYACPPQSLTEKYLHTGEKAWYFFFNTSIQKNQVTSDQGRWIYDGDKKDAVIHEGKKVGGKQALVYCEGNDYNKTKYKMMVYNLEPLANGRRFFGQYVCKLYADENYEDVQNQPQHSNESQFNQG